MRTLVWSESFKRAFKRSVQRNPELRTKIQRTLERLAENPFHPGLHSHKLKGELAGVWACVVDYDNRILFDFKTSSLGEEEILLITMGTHDEVY